MTNVYDGNNDPVENGSQQFARMHTNVLFGRAPKLKMNRDKFRENSQYAHLIGRAFACELIMKKHNAQPYENVDELLGDLQIEYTECVNKFRSKCAFHSMPVLRVEDFLSYE